MADSHHSNDSPGMVWLGLILGGVLFGALGYWFTTQVEPVDKTSFEFGPLVIDEAKLASEREQQYASKVDLEDPKAKRLIEIVNLANADQFVTLDDREKLRRSQELQIAANEALELDEMQGFHAIGTTFFDKCEEGLKAVIANKPEREVILSDEKYKTYRDYCGDLVPHLQRLKILDDKSDWVDDSGMHIVRIMNRYRWAFILAKRAPLHEQLTPYEYRTLETWRTTSDAFTVEERLAFAKRSVERIPDFPTDELIAKMYVQADDFEKAHPYMARWCKSDKTPQTGAMCRWFEGQRGGDSGH